MGAPYDIYSLNDLNFKDCSKYKMLIFIGAFKLNKKQENEIKKLKSNDRTLFFIGTPNIVNGLVKSEELLNAKLIKNTNLESTIISKKYSYGYEHEKYDTYAANDSSVIELGKYKNNGKTALY